MSQSTKFPLDLKFELFIASRLLKSDKGSNNYTRPIINVSTAAISLGIIVMTLSLSIVSGFQNEIRDKVIGFGAHIQVNSYESRNSLEYKPISKNQDFYPGIEDEEGIRHIQVFALKPGIVKTKDEIQGVVLKGIANDFDWEFFKSNLVEGESFVPNDSGINNAVVISKSLATRLNLNVGDDLRTYFIQEPPRARKFNISGIYESGFEQFDEMYCLIDIRHIQKLNDWEPDQISGFEILIDDFKKLWEFDRLVYDNIGYDLNTTSIVESNPDIFNWLELQDINVYIIIILMIVVAAINIVSALLILILDRINMIGTLKALGAANWSIRKIFLINSAYLIIKGLFWGNIIGIGLCLLQLYTGVVTLPQESYYVSEVPININLTDLLLLNLGVLTVCLIIIILPSYIITRISPVKAIRFD